jgi:hypothetical protein
VRCAPEPCSISMDGQPLTPGVQYTLPGTHDFVAFGPNRARMTEHLSVIAGASYKVTLRLGAELPASSDEPVAPRNVAHASAQHDESATAPKKPLPPALFWAGAAGTAVLAGLTTWSGLDALSAKHAHAYTESEIDEINSRARRTNFFLAGTLVLGASTAAAGLWLVEWNSRARAALIPLPEGGALLSARASF